MSELEDKIITHQTVRHSPEQVTGFLNDVQIESPIAALTERGITQFSYEVSAYPLAKHFLDMLENDNILSQSICSELRERGLEYLHEYVPPELKAVNTGEINAFTEKLYDQSEAFITCFREMLADNLGSHFDSDFYFQATTTIRCVFPFMDDFKWKPRFHSDIILGHPPHEINVWLPLTRVHDSNSMRIMPLEQSQEVLDPYWTDMQSYANRVQTDDGFFDELTSKSYSLDLEYGEYAVFDSRCLHCTQYNVTETTRISLDFRILPVSSYDQFSIEYRGTGRRKMLFAPGHYFHETSIKQRK